jgi:membrane protease YdiL (CAAX protease family)
MERPDKALLQAGVAFAAFAGLSYLGRHLTIAFHLMGVLGLAIPLLWGWRTRRWAEMGFTPANWRQGVIWGLGTGFLTSLIGVATVRRIEPPADLPLQLAVGIPMSLLLASPFQEFFFRGWLQPRLVQALGKWGGLLVTTGLFTLWHYLAPLDQATEFPLHSVLGLVSTYLAGAAYGYAFLRTGSMIAPWLGHALALITFIVIGTGGFIPAA